MITNKERLELDALLGDMPRRVGLEEELVAGGEVQAMLGRLFEAMQRRDLSQADLARAMGVHRRQILRWLKGDGAIPTETLIAMGRHVGLKMDVRWVDIASVDESVVPDADWKSEGVRAPVEYAEALNGGSEGRWTATRPERVVLALVPKPKEAA
jgi:transcriptional regulator with XRE-family HTH domain